MLDVAIVGGGVSGFLDKQFLSCKDYNHLMLTKTTEEPKPKQ
jgi:hypothetical protein